MFINKEKKQKCESNFVIVSSYQTCEETADNQAALSIDLRIIYGENVDLDALNPFLKQVNHVQALQNQECTLNIIRAFIPCIIVHGVS
jgi:hypothetical protein